MKPFFALMMIFFLVSCDRSNRKNLNTGAKSDSLSLPLITRVERFSLPFSKEIPDSNGLFFYFSQRFDTSFFVHLERQSIGIRGVLYEITPSYHRDDKDFADSASQLLFFDGYSFAIDSIRWDNMVKKASGIFVDGHEPSKTEVCLDCPYYFLAYNRKVTDSYEKGRPIFEAFAQFLKDSLLNQYIRKRQPVLHKSLK